MSDIGGIWGILRDTYKYYIFWKDMKGKRIVLINHTFEVTERSELTKHLFEIEGTIEDVMLLPLGFKLKDVKERYRINNYHLKFGLNQQGPYGISHGNCGSFIAREIKEKIISFTSIQQYELKEAYDEANEHPRME